MNLLAKALLVLLYPLVILARLVNALRGTDPLRLKGDPDAASFWIEREAEPSRASYFSEASETEGRRPAGAGRLVTALLRMVAKGFAPSKPREGVEASKPAVDREQGIPDEVYTLW